MLTSPKITTGVHLMQTTQIRKGIALLAVIPYLALALAAPFLHRHGSGDAGAGRRVAAGRWPIRAGTAGHERPCPSCEWQKVARMAPPTPLTCGLVARLIERFI